MSVLLQSFLRIGAFPGRNILVKKVIRFYPLTTTLPSINELCKLVAVSQLQVREISTNQKEENGRNTGKPEKNTQNTGKELDIARESPYAGLSPTQKVKEATKDASYLVVIVVGIGILGMMMYYIFWELFSSQSPSGVYGNALKLCQQDERLKFKLGEPIKGYGETTSRGRRRYVSHTEYTTPDGVRHMMMQFYVEGPKRKGTAHLDVYKNEHGKYDYRFLFIDLDATHETVVIRDKR
ncbi:hypothetical protein CHS0354_026975 [Potamilus streckersoni]|uniref:Mitochondrial import inner membrane translocase subunit Tim21 n=1 Tax=Potamilus streckersoni TaxID=2493646 RepID=A0AAE0VST6_9BIVA|nr:hypothetical protein CHS0354_026975 [Potamilus streckersoni]